VLVDTSTLLRTVQVHNPQYELAMAAIEVLSKRGRGLHIVAQNLIEVWVVATRPIAQNGLGLAPQSAEADLKRIKTMFGFLPETPAIYPVWEGLVTRHKVSGKSAHDARLVAAMQVHGLTAILTFDRSDFARYPEIEVVHPQDLKR
jgi:predicted nucleic acid-binding protein